MAPFADLSHVSVAGVRVAYRRAGSGPPVLLIHGIPTSSRLWDLVAPALTGDRDVVAIDMVGYGGSDKPLDRDVSVAAQAELLPSLLDALGLGRVSVVAHDIGGAVAQILAVHEPARVSALCLVDSVSSDSWPIAGMRAFARAAPLVERLPPRTVMALFERGLVRDLTDPAGREAAAASIAAWTGDRAGLRAFTRNAAALDARHTLAVAPRLGEIAVPAHVVWGARDPFQRAEWAPRLRDAIPGATLRMLDAGHFVPWERPAELAAEVRELLGRAGT